MILFKSIFNGIGTGAGVAWPSFGIVFSLIGASIGGALSVTLGVITIGLFTVISALVFYLSYKRMHEELQHNESILLKNEQKLINLVGDYIYTLYKEYQVSNKTIKFQEYLSIRAKHSFLGFDKESQTVLHQILINKHAPDSNFSDSSVLIPIKQQRMHSYSSPFIKGLVAAFYGFVGTFGSIAGCSAGVAGVLTGMGLFSSFAAFPIIGLSILGVACLLGVFAGVSASIEAQETYKNNLWNQTVKTTYQSLKKHNSNLAFPACSNSSSENDTPSSINHPLLFTKKRDIELKNTVDAQNPSLVY